ncbi:unnamed protein product [Chrysodeixis includens]|uniref:Major facilitator superfamily (MFS) profile domain-containing protein n=1 Tax=Chrysodeixis includens TaxID=689277 RepID=A0A9P0BMM1_CHRIL|nr:unnamed protein product [Chrysodeixis includens]
MGENEKNYNYSKVSAIDGVIEKENIPLKYGFGVRHTQLVIYFFCILVGFIARGHMGVTVVAMTSNFHRNVKTEDTHVINGTGREYNATIEDLNNTVINESVIGDLENVTEKRYKTYDWPKSTQEMMLGSFFLGYCIMTFPIGLLTQRFGGKLPLQLALLVNGLVSVMTPWLTDLGGWKAVCACRIAQGLSQAGLYPSIQNLLAKWVPINERGTLTSYVYTGSTIGTVVAFQLSGLLSDSRWGWPSVFWAVGMICLALFLVLTVFGAATPAQHRSISVEEKNYIMGRIVEGKVRRPKTPWKAILRSRPMWATLATHVGSGLIFVFFFTQMPSYIHYILGINVRSSGLLSSLPYVVSFFTSLAFGIISDYLTNNKILSVRNARRIFNTFAQLGICLPLVLASFTTNQYVVLFCLVFAMAAHVAIHVGWMVNHIDLAPNFSGTLMMLGNVLMNICNVLLPILVANVVTDVGDQIQWRIMFFIVATVSLSCNVVFVLWMSGDVQPWNDIDENDTSLEDIKSEYDDEVKEKQAQD